MRSTHSRLFWGGMLLLAAFMPACGDDAEMPTDPPVSGRPQPQSAAQGVSLVDAGQATAAIVTADAPSASASRAAAELQHFVKEITGARLRVVTESQAAQQTDLPANRVYIGRTDATKAHVQILPAGDDRLHTREGFELQAGDGAVYAVGNEDAICQGTEYAVYELLERLGCRWFFPGEFGQVLPKTDTLTVPAIADVRQSPSFAVRNIWMSGWATGTGDHNPWMIRNKGTQRGGFAFPGDGSIWKLAPMDKYLEQYPELYAMKADGTRQDLSTPPYMRMIDTAHPKAVEIASNTIKEHFRAHPDDNSYAFSAPDGSPRSLSPEAIAADHGFALDSGQDVSISDAYYDFINNVMYAVAEEFPDKFIVVLAYANRVRPPEGLDQPWHPNIIIQLARLRISTLKEIGNENDVHAQRHARTLDAWARICPQMMIYDYDPHAGLSRMPNWRTGAAASDMRFYKDHNVIGFTTEGHNTFLRNGLNYYLRTKLMWNVDADVDAILGDFYVKFFEDAAEPMRRFHEAIDRMRDESLDGMTWTGAMLDWTKIYPVDQTIALGEHLDEAEKLAQSDAVKTHLAAYRAMHDYMIEYNGLFEHLRAGDIAKAIESYKVLPTILDRTEAIQPGLLPHLPAWVNDRGDGMGYLWRVLEFYRQRTLGGTDDFGKRLGLAPRTGQFRRDRRNVGLWEQWHHDVVAKTLQWEPIDLTYRWGVQGFRDDDGYPYDGYAWYRFPIEIDKPADTGGAVQLVVPHLSAARCWIWVNDNLVFSPADIPMDMSMIHLKQGGSPIHPERFQPFVISYRGVMTVQCHIDKWVREGENTVTIRMDGFMPRLNHHGLAARPFIWQPASPK